MNRNPATNPPLPPDAIQRVLCITPQVHIYRIPAITSTKGFNAASWTQNPADLIFTARLRVMETSIGDRLSAAILLEDAKTGELFAAAPYTHPSVVEQALDSSRFFAVRVVSESGMKATLGMGFEQRPEAFDFGVALQDIRRGLGMDGAKQQQGKPSGGQRAGIGGFKPTQPDEIKRDLSLKEGETITINIGNKGKRPAVSMGSSSLTPENASYTLPPPPSSGKPSSNFSMAFLPPPPSAASVRAAQKRKSQEQSAQPTAEDLGFDDGEFGEFQ
jgi:hypothetical protein